MNIPIMSKGEMTTPASINKGVTLLCREIDSTQNPIFLELVEVEGVEVDECFEDVRLYAEKHGGSIQYGWTIWEIPEIFIEGVFHAVWKNTKGDLVDITPKRDKEEIILFLPDSTRKYEGRAVDNKRKRLVKNEYTQRLVESGKIMFNSLYKSNNNKKKLGRNHSCFCGSGKKYKKCCLKKN